MRSRARAVVRKWGAIGALLALALAAAVVARDAAAVRQAMAGGDFAFAARPDTQDLWHFRTMIPYTDEIFGLEDDLLYRGAVWKYAAEDRRKPQRFNFARPGLRADAQAVLSDAESSDLSPALRSKLATLEGMVSLDEAVANPVNGNYALQQTVSHFQRAVRIDPSNTEAKYNLELLLRLLNPKGNANQTRTNLPIFEAGPGTPGAGPNRRGHGY